VISVHQDTVEDLFDLEPARGTVFPAEIIEIAEAADARRVSLLTILGRAGQPVGRLLVLELNMSKGYPSV
jgi:hypothetical protein